jgi:N utilization substance protein A
VKGVVKELQGEKIDIIRYSDDVTEFVKAALSPAEVSSVKITDPEEQKAEIVVSDDQLSLAIGKNGQNVRLASKLTGWSIDIRSKKEVVKEKLEAVTAPGESTVAAPGSLESIEGIGPKTAKALAEAGLNTAEDLKNAKISDLSGIKGIGKKTLEKILAAVGRNDEVVSTPEETADVKEDAKEDENPEKDKATE